MQQTTTAKIQCTIWPPKDPDKITVYIQIHRLVKETKKLNQFKYSIKKITETHMTKKHKIIFSFLSSFEDAVFFFCYIFFGSHRIGIELQFHHY